ncbi:hybrid sensor histidine kinase/response regulator [Pelagicoccus mobilis]|uniref:histidine kinase n=1 Tax=Pelagicoccus mobilis TaxID=415221 RepID=A0A934S0R3_9BACT|nr:hybrid sensor histidine kinase/response regulator [Pelagicoccus mobilis]MBK1878879.1 response regulator [Pelagicoccus mobilis]
MLLRIACLCGLLASTLPLSAQIKFNHLETDAPVHLVRTIHRDDYGYLWLGTAGEGLKRYDGYSFKTYTSDPERENTLSGRYIQDVLEDSQKNLWIAARSGLNRYDRKLDNFKRYTHSGANHNTLGRGPVQEMLLAKNGELWVLTRRSLNRFRPQTDNFQRHNFPNSSERDYFLTSLIEGEGNKIWVVGSDSHIWSFDREREEFTSSKLFPLSDNKSKKIRRDNRGRLWIASQGGGLYQFLPDEMKIAHIPINKDGTGISGGRTDDIAVHPDGTLLIPVNQAGLNLFDPETRTVRYQSFADGTGNGISSDGVNLVHIDYEGIIWLGHSRTGLDYHHPQLDQFITFKRGVSTPQSSITNHVIGAVAEDPDGNLLIGTDGGGLHLLDRTSNSIRKLELQIESGVIRQVAVDPQENLWVATWNAGIYYFQKKGDRYELDQEITQRFDEWKERGIWDIELDHKNRIWISGGFGKLSLYQTDGTPIPIQTESPTDRIPPNIVIEDTHPGGIFANGLDGMYRFDEETKTTKLFAKLPRPTAIRYEPKSQTYYIGTVYSGIHSYDTNGNHLKTYNILPGRLNRRVHAIEIANENAIWVSTESGLCHINTQTSDTQVYLGGDGLQGDQYFDMSSCKTRDGYLFFGGTSGFTGFHPDHITHNLTPPRVYIDEISLFGTPISPQTNPEILDSHPQFAQSLTLEHHQNHLQFGFTGISLVSPKKNKFAYKLEGFDSDWIYTSSDQRRATYTNLDPGSYTFRVKASNNDGIWNEQGAAIQVEIATPFWLRPSFLILSALLVSSLAYLAIRYREAALTREKAKLKAMVQEKTKQLSDHQEQLEATIDRRTSALKSAKEKAEESDRLKSQFLANLSHEIRTPLNAITGFAGFIADDSLDSSERSRYAEIINENSDSLLTLIGDILDFSKITSNQLKIIESPFSLNEFLDNIHSSHSIRENPNSVSHTLNNQLHKENLILVADRTRIKQVIDNLLTNAFKFTQSGTVELGAYCQESQICYYVKDSGPGIPEEERQIIFEKFVKREIDDLAARRGVGLGLAICKELTELMGGSLSVESEVGIGSTFTLSLPLRIAKDLSVTNLEGEDPQHDNEYRGKKILVIEDEQANYEFIDVSLQKLGIETDWAKDGREGLEKLRSTSEYDLVLLDIKMPGIDGFETLKEIRKINASINVIAQTAYALKTDEVKIRRAGFDGYIAKPIKQTELQVTLETSLGN